MPTPNISQVTTANTFDQWRIQTNNLINVANELRNSTYEKEAGLLYLSNTTIDTALHVKSNVIIEGILTLGSPGKNVIRELANSSNTTSVSANGGSIQYNSRINFVNSSTLLVSVSSGSSGNANVQFEVVGGVGGTGAQGAQGRQGSRGFQGLTGTNGTNGSPGAAGTPGTNGTNGSPGAQGEIGAQGLRGAQGFQGDRGFQGYQGAPGTGAPGAQGNTGSPGSPGAQGEPGIGATARAADSTSTGAMAYAGFTSAAGQFYGGTTNPSGTTRLNYAGHLHATKLFGDGSSITGLPSGLAARAATSADTGAVAYNGNTEATGQFYGGTTVPTGSTRINYSGYLYATRFYGDATYLSNLPTTTPTRAADSTSTGAMAFNGDTLASGQFYGGTTNPSGTTRLNYAGHLHATKLFGDGSSITGVTGSGGLIRDTSDVTITSTEAKVAFNSTSFDALGKGSFNTTTNRYTASQAVKVIVLVTINIANLDSGDEVQITLRKNGNTNVGYQILRNDSGTANLERTLHITRVLNLATSDFLEVYIQGIGTMDTAAYRSGEQYTSLDIVEL